MVGIWVSQEKNEGQVVWHEWCEEKQSQKENEETNLPGNEALIRGVVGGKSGGTDWNQSAKGLE